MEEKHAIVDQEYEDKLSQLNVRIKLLIEEIDKNISDN
jgi:hypothetical protein